MKKIIFSTILGFLISLICIPSVVASESVSNLTPNNLVEINGTKTKVVEKVYDSRKDSFPNSIIYNDGIYSGQLLYWYMEYRSALKYHVFYRGTVSSNGPIHQYNFPLE